MKRLAAALEHKVPPPLIGALCASLMWLICGMPPLTGRPPLLLVPALALVVLGLTVDAAGVLSFRRARTTVNPFAPERTVNIVSSGIYRLSRNPMYLGMACILTGWAVWLWQVQAVLGVVLFVTWITRFQIIPEERVLTQKFGTEYRPAGTALGIAQHLPKLCMAGLRTYILPNRNPEWFGDSLSYVCLFRIDLIAVGSHERR